MVMGMHMVVLRLHMDHMGMVVLRLMLMVAMDLLMGGMEVDMVIRIHLMHHRILLNHPINPMLHPRVACRVKVKTVPTHPDHPMDMQGMYHHTDIHMIMDMHSQLINIMPRGSIPRY
jgi:hypothetical protein